MYPLPPSVDEHVAQHHATEEHHAGPSLFMKIWAWLLLFTAIEIVLQQQCHRLQRVESRRRQDLHLERLVLAEPRLAQQRFGLLEIEGVELGRVGQIGRHFRRHARECDSE